MAIAKLERIKARALKVGDNILLGKDGDYWPSGSITDIVPAKVKLTAFERQTPAHRMKIRTTAGKHQILPTADVFILPREVPKKRAPRKKADI